MDYLETKMFSDAPTKPNHWRRYKNDVFLLWKESEDSLSEFQDHLNSNQQSIKFTFETFNKQVSFLDVMVYL